MIFYDDQFVDSIFILRLTLRILGILSALFIIVTIWRGFIQYPKQININQGNLLKQFAYKLIFLQAIVNLIVSIAQSIILKGKYKTFCMILGYIIKSGELESNIIFFLITISIWKTIKEYQYQWIKKSLSFYLIFSSIGTLTILGILFEFHIYGQRNFQYETVQYSFECGQVSYDNNQYYQYYSNSFIAMILLIDTINIIMIIKLKQFSMKVIEIQLSLRINEMLNISIFAYNSFVFWTFRIIINLIFPLFLQQNTRTMFILITIPNFYSFFNGFLFYIVFRKFINFQKIWSCSNTRIKDKSSETIKTLTKSHTVNDENEIWQDSIIDDDDKFIHKVSYIMQDSEE